MLAKHLMAHTVASVHSSYSLVGGVIAQRPVPGWLLHGAYLAALESAMRSLALELRPVRVNLVSTGPVDTGAWGNVPPEQNEQIRKIVEPRCVTGAMATVEQVAEAFLYIIRNANATGTVVTTDSGVSVMP